jgi:hypothetical protein
MTAKTLLVAGAIIALGATPVLAGSGCSGYGHASKQEIIADSNQSTSEDAQTYTAVPYPAPTLEEDTLTASVAADKKTTTE